MGFFDSPAGQATQGAVLAYINDLLSKFGVGTQGTGRMAQRGQFAAQMKLARGQFAEQQLAARRAEGWLDFARTNPFEEGFAVDMITGNVPGKLIQQLNKTSAKLDRLELKKQGKRTLQREKKLQQKLTAREAKLAPFTDTRVSELRGPNAGYWKERGAPAPLFLTQRSVG